MKIFGKLRRARSDTKIEQKYAAIPILQLCAVGEQSEIEPRIKSLVNNFNKIGLHTYASCEGHFVFAGNAALPYISFKTSNLSAVRRLAELLSNDRMLIKPNLFWAWEVQPFFDASQNIVFRLSLLKPYSTLTRFLRCRLDSDIQKIGNLASHAANFHN